MWFVGFSPSVILHLVSENLSSTRLPTHHTIFTKQPNGILERSGLTLSTRAQDNLTLLGKGGVRGGGAELTPSTESDSSIQSMNLFSNQSKSF